MLQGFFLGDLASYGGSAYSRHSFMKMPKEGV